jgi:Ca-activated chloride channel family protein
MTLFENDPRLTAYALGELEGEERLEIERLLADDPRARAEVEAVRAVVGRLDDDAVDAAAEGLDPLRRERILAAAGQRKRSRWVLLAAPAGLAAATILVALAVSALTQRTTTVMEPQQVLIAAGDVEARNEAWEGGLERSDVTSPTPPGLREPVDARPPAPPSGPTTPVGWERPEPVIRDAEISDHVETDNDLPFEETLGEDGLSDAPFTGPANNGLIGLGGAAGGAFHGRGGARELRRFEGSGGYVGPDATPPPPSYGTEAYGEIQDNRFYRVADKDTSTFSIDVDTASYANVRRFLDQEGRLPPPNAVRIEELVNYFPYEYQPPATDSAHPFAAHTAVAICPWEPKHRLVRVALKGKVLQQAERPAANLVFLLDVSGSMSPANKLPLVKRSMQLLLDRLEARDKVSIVVYAGAAGLVLAPTAGNEQAQIRAALERLQSGGSTNGGAGIELAYRLAQENFVEGGVNRVILCTDGDFNVGVSNTESLAQLIERRAKGGVYLSILGFGMGNLKDDRMEELSNRGNGNYGYIDNLREAQKVLVDQGLSTLVTIAKDVKIQIFFNPKRVAGWRLIGYENRILRKQDFNDDTKDAGEIGAGHAVTALYEIVPAGGEVAGAYEDPNPFVQPVEQPETEPVVTTDSNALLRLRLRYKAPDGDRSTLMEQDLFDANGEIDEADTDFQWATAVAGFGMLLRDSPYKGGCSWELVEEIASGARGEDPRGYRAECLQLMRLASSFTR